MKTTVKILKQFNSAHKYEARHDQNINLPLIKFYGFLNKFNSSSVWFLDAVTSRLCQHWPGITLQAVDGRKYYNRIL